MIQDTVVIGGECSLETRIDGDPNVVTGTGVPPLGTKSILLTEAGTKTEDVTDYAYAEINAVTSATASGAVVSFSDGAEDVPMDSCVVDIEPVQDLHGQDAPYPPGAGKNKLPKGSNSTSDGITFTVNDDGTVTVTGTATSTAFWGTQFSIPAGTYIINGCPSGGGSSTYRIDVRDNVAGIVIPNISSDTGSGTTFTITEALTAYLNIRIASGYSAPSGGLKFSPMIRLSSVTDATFAPYSNICPISGWSNVNVTRTGKNLFGGTYLNYFALPLPQGTVVTASCSTETAAPRMTYYDANKNLLDYWTLTSTTNDGTRRYKTFTIIADAMYFSMSANNAKEVQIELSSVPTSYEPFGDTYTISLGQTVYGGTLDVVSGVLTVDRGYVEYDGSNDENWTLYNVSQGKLYRINCPNRVPNKELTSIKIACNSFSIKTSSSRTDGSLSSSSSGTNFDFIYNNCTTIDEWQSWLASNHVQVAFELATPTTVQLTPTEVTTLLGSNNVWADSGDITVGYKADIYLYADSLETIIDTLTGGA